MNTLSAFLNALSPRKFFLFASLIFGFVFMLLVPPIQVPDEPNHFFRAWQVSEGQWIATRYDQRAGGRVPVYLQKFHDIFVPIVWYGPDSRLTREQLMEAASISQSDTSRVFIDFNNTAIYSPVLYAPAAIGICLARGAGANLLTVFYVARLFNFLFWLLCSYSAMRLLPMMKWLFSLLMLLPTTVFINQSLSADSVTNSVCILFFALTLSMAYGNRAFNRTVYFIFIFLTFLLASVKVVYTPLILLLLLIPTSKFGSIKQRCLSLSVLFVVAVLTVLVWLHFTKALHIPYKDYHPEFRHRAALAPQADVYDQMDFIKKKGVMFKDILFRSFISGFKSYLPGYIGIFGWLELPLPLTLVYLICGSIMFILCFDYWQMTGIPRASTMLCFSVFLMVFSLIFISQYLNWETVGADRTNIQGRYLVPCMPVLFFSLQGRSGKKSVFVPLLVLITVAAGFAVSVFLLYHRYLAGAG